MSDGRPPGQLPLSAWDERPGGCTAQRTSLGANEVKASTADTLLQAHSITGDVHLHPQRMSTMMFLLVTLFTVTVCAIAVAQQSGCTCSAERHWT